jgi:uncharacterized membrane protein
MAVPKTLFNSDITLGIIFGILFIIFELLLIRKIKKYDEDNNAHTEFEFFVALNMGILILMTIFSPIVVLYVSYLKIFMTIIGIIAVAIGIKYVIFKLAFKPKKKKKRNSVLLKSDN